MYKLWTDKQEEFKAKIRLEGASLSNTFCRLVVEGQDISLIFDGEINGDGVVVPIRALDGLMEAGTAGHMRLEVIADDTYFVPWKSDFSVDSSRKVAVEVVDQNANSEKRTPKVDIVVDTPSTIKEGNYKKKRKRKEEAVEDINSVIKAFVKELVKGKQSISKLRQEFLGKLDLELQERVIKASLHTLKEIRR